MRFIIPTLTALFVVACTPTQQARREAAQINAENRAKEHVDHVELLRREYAALQHMLEHATRASWHAIVECDACEDESLLPKDTPLPPAEFAEFKSLIRQARPIAPLSAEKLFLDTLYDVDAKGEVSPYIKIHPMRLTVCGGVMAQLVLYDAAGKCVGTWFDSYCGKASSMAEYNNMDQWGRPYYILPDAAYNRLLSLPTGVAFTKKTEAASRSH